MLENELWGNTIENWGISILIILGAIIIVKLLSLLGKKVIKPFVTGTDNHLDDVIFYSLEAPVKNLDRYPSVGLSGQFCESS